MVKNVQINFYQGHFYVLGNYNRLYQKNRLFVVQVWLHKFVLNSHARFFFVKLHTIGTIIVGFT